MRSVFVWLGSVHSLNIEFYARAVFTENPLIASTHADMCRRVRVCVCVLSVNEICY